MRITYAQYNDYLATGSLPGEAPKQNKYKNKRVSAEESPDGRSYPSQGECERSQCLRLLQKTGVISLLQYQVSFALTVNGVVLGHYRADWVYQEAGKTVIEDWKGCVTDIFAWKWKHLQAQYGEKYVYRLTGKQRKPSVRFGRRGFGFQRKAGRASK